MRGSADAQGMLLCRLCQRRAQASRTRSAHSHSRSARPRLCVAYWVRQSMIAAFSRAVKQFLPADPRAVGAPVARLSCAPRGAHNQANSGSSRPYSSRPQVFTSPSLHVPSLHARSFHVRSLHVPSLHVSNLHVRVGIRSGIFIIRHRRSSRDPDCGQTVMVPADQPLSPHSRFLATSIDFNPSGQTKCVGSRPTKRTNQQGRSQCAISLGVALILPLL